MPTHRAGMAAFLMAAICACAPAVAAQNTCVWIGDSLDSYVVGGDYTQAAVHLIQAERDVAIRNLSSPGATLGETGVTGFNSAYTTDALDHIDGFFGEVDCIVIAAGTNDFNRVGWPAVAASLNRIFEWAETHGVKVLMLDLIWRGAFEGTSSPAMGRTFAAYRTSRMAACSYFHASVCTFAPRPPALDAANSALYAPDGVHLTVAGQRTRADWIEGAAAPAGIF